MARFRRKRSRRASRSPKFRRSRGGSKGITPMDAMLAGAIYGVARPFAANVIPDILPNIGPVSSDNMVIGAASWWASKQSNKLIKAIGTVGLAAETSMVVNKAMAGSGGMSPGTQPSLTYNLY